MCLYPKYIKNPRYKGAMTEQLCTDKRQLYVPIGCGNCIECRRQKAQSWKVRLCEELKTTIQACFITLTFSNESLIEISKEINSTSPNTVAGIAVRKFLERYRKKYGHSLKHWLITELGHENTERIHLHGILFSQEIMTKEIIEKLWKYGNIFYGEYCNVKTINYIVKYVTKIDTDHKNYKAVIFCSPGLGSNFVKTIAAKNTYKYKQGETPEYYTLPNGRKVALPTYYKNKLYTEEERQQIWSDRLDRSEIYVMGIKIPKIDTEKGYQEYQNILHEQQKLNKKIGYGSDSEEWKEKEYNITFRMLQKAARAQKNAHTRL